MLNIGRTSTGRLAPIVRPTNSVLFIWKMDSSVAMPQKDVTEVRPYEDIPGPKPLPLIGNSWRFLPYIGEYSGSDPSELFRKLHEQYGNIFKLTNLPGRNDMVVTFDPRDYETVFRTEGPWPLRAGLEAMKEYRSNLRRDFYKGIEGLGTSQGKEWHDLRSKFNPTLMQPRNTKTYVGPIDDVAKDLIIRLRELRNEKGELPPDFINWISRWALESISLIALDTRLGCLDREFSADSDAQKMINVTRTVLEAIFQLNLTPGITHFTKKKEWHDLVGAIDCANGIAMKYVRKAMEEMKKKSPKDDRELSVLETLLLKHEDPMYGVVMAVDMLLGGIDTTAHASAVLLHYLARNQDKQEKLFQELKNILQSKDQTVTARNLDDMKYLKACIKESMRLTPIAGGNTRTTVQDIVLSNYRIPKGTEIMMGNMITTNKEEHFPQPDRFIPERWLKGAEEQQKAHPFAFLPFGFGPRMCIGRRFAELEIETLAAKVIRNFRLEYDQELQIKSNLLNLVVSPLSFRLEDRQ